MRDSPCLGCDFPARRHIPVGRHSTRGGANGIAMVLPDKAGCARHASKGAIMPSPYPTSGHALTADVGAMLNGIPRARRPIHRLPIALRQGKIAPTSGALSPNCIQRGGVGVHAAFRARDRRRHHEETKHDAPTGNTLHKSPREPDTMQERLLPSDYSA